LNTKFSHSHTIPCSFINRYICRTYPLFSQMYTTPVHLCLSLLSAPQWPGLQFQNAPSSTLRLLCGTPYLHPCVNLPLLMSRVKHWHFLATSSFHFSKLINFVLKILSAIGLSILTHRPFQTSTLLPLDYVVGDWDCIRITVSVKSKRIYPYSSGTLNTS